MTRKELIIELFNLKYAYDVPVRHRPVITAMIDTIMDAPAIEAQPVRSGRWVKDLAPWCRCSACGAVLNEEQIPITKYCYSCGARMEGKE